MKTIYRYDKSSGEVIEAARADPMRRGGVFLLPDISQAYPAGGFQSPIDDSWITSRSQLREHNKRHGVFQSGDIRGERLKNDMKKHMRFDPARRADPSFSWVDPSIPGRSKRAGNLTEI